MDHRAVAQPGVRVSGRFLTRVVEFERDALGDPLYRDGELVVRRVVEDWREVPNGATTAGLNYVLEAAFRGGTAVTTWYAGLINNASYTTGVASGDTAGSHGGWVEWTGYTESVRQTWSPAAASGGVLANTTVMTFTNNTGSAVTVRGLFLQSTSTKGSTSGTLWATAVESSGRSLADGQALQAIYQVTFTPAS